MVCTDARRSVSVGGVFHTGFEPGAAGSPSQAVRTGESQSHGVLWYLGIVCWLDNGVVYHGTDVTLCLKQNIQIKFNLKMFDFSSRGGEERVQEPKDPLP